MRGTKGLCDASSLCCRSRLLCGCELDGGTRRVGSPGIVSSDRHPFKALLLYLVHPAARLHVLSLIILNTSFSIFNAAMLLYLSGKSNCHVRDGRAGVLVIPLYLRHINTHPAHPSSCLNVQDGGVKFSSLSPLGSANLITHCLRRNLHITGFIQKQFKMQLLKASFKNSKRNICGLA